MSLNLSFSAWTRRSGEADAVPTRRSPRDAYGAEDDGLICAYRFDPDVAARLLGSRGQSCDLEEARAWLAEARRLGAPLAEPAVGRASGLAQEAQAEVSVAELHPLPAVPGTGMAPGFLWLHFNLSNNQAERWISRHGGLPPEFVEAIQGGLASTRIERIEAALLAILNDLQFDFDFEPSDTATLWVCLDRQVIITGRRKPLRSIDQLRGAVREGLRLRSPADLLAALLRRQADVLIDLVRRTTARVDEIEDRLLAGRLAHKRLRLGAMRRLLVRLQRLLVPEPAALFRLLQHPPEWMVEADAQDLREASEEFSLVLRDMVSLQERVKLLQEEVAAQVNETNSRSLFVLSVVTVLALPINIIAGLFGMNVGGIPMAQYEHGFLVIVLIVAVFTVVAAWFSLGRRGDD